MKIFISCPFTGICKDDKYEIKDEYKDFFNKLTDGISQMGFEYYLAIKRENWGIDHKGPEECTKQDYMGVKESDFLIVIPGNIFSNGISGGVHIELGWASAMKKKLYILVEKGYSYSPVLLGLSSLTETKYYNCEEFLNDSMLELIFDIIQVEAEERNIKCI